MSRGLSAPSLPRYAPTVAPRNPSNTVHHLQIVRAVQILQKFYAKNSSNRGLSDRVVHWINPATPEGNQRCKTLALSVVMIGGFFLYKCRQSR